MKRLYAIIFSVLLSSQLSACRAAVPGETPAGGASAGVASNESLSSDNSLIAQYSKKMTNNAGKDFTLDDLNGKSWKLSDLKGKTVLLNFWATWCGPCQREMPGFQKLYDRFGESGDVIVLAVASTSLERGSADSALKSVEQFADEQGYTFPILFDTDGSVWEQYMQQGVPANYILDGSGNVRLLLLGAFRNEDEIYAALEAVRRAESGG